MPEGQPAPRTASYLKRFNIWFGAIFLGIALLLLVLGAGISGVVIYLTFDTLPDPAMALLMPGIFLAISVVFAGIGTAFLIPGLRRARREARLLREGTDIDATIVSIAETGTRVNRRHLWRIRYTYDDYAARPVEGDSGYLSAEEAHSYAVGERVRVRYNPDRPSESVWLGRPEAAG